MRILKTSINIQSLAKLRELVFEHSILGFESEIDENKNDEELNDEVVLINDSKKRKISEQNLFH